MKKKSTLQSAFFNPRILFGFALGLFGLALSLFAAGVLPGTTATQASGPAAKGDSKGSLAKNHVIWATSVKNDVSAPLRDMPAISVTLQARNCELKDNPPTKIPHTDGPDGALYNLEGPKLALAQPNVPATTLNFEGIDFPGVVCSCNPPDTDGAVGLNQYVQEVNEGLQVFNKSTGASQFGPVAVSSLWSGFGGVCQNAGEGDVVVLYDHFANRWLVSQFAATGSTITDECVAVSTSPDATGSYYRYDFVLNPTFGNNYFDYPKIGIWSDAYYLSFNIFNIAGTSFLGPQPFAIDKNAMLQGNPATIVGPVGPLGSAVGPMLPADIDGMTLPPSGAPETYLGFPAAGNYPIYHFHADFGTPANSTWTTFATPAAAAFTQLCTAGRSCVPQPGVAMVSASAGSGLDGIGDRFMFRAAYRNFGTQASPNESLVSNYNVCASGTCTAGTGVGQSGVRWIQLGSVTNGPVTVTQESTYNNGGADVLWRWMGSIAQDNAGDMMLGFSTSAGTTGTNYPSIHYTGRLSTDPANSMAQGEATMFAGAGSQSSSGNRWGDYSAMTVDPEDDCTFWYTQEYYPTGANQFDWRTRIANFAFTQCTPQTAQSVAAVSVYNIADFTSFNPGATAGFTLTVNSSGNTTLNGISYSDPLPSGQGINWSITTPVAGWAITGSPPSQSLAFTPGGGSMASGTSSSVHIQSSTSSTLCGSSSLSHTATVTTTNGGTGFATGSSAIDCTNCTPNAFTDNSPQNASPVAILDQAVTSLGSNVYMFGGVQGGAFGTGAYKLSSNVWTAVASLAAANERESPVAVSDGSQYIYYLNGLNSAGTAQSTNIRYDTVGNVYATEAANTFASWAAGAAYFNGKVYVMGGLNTAGTASVTNLSIYTVSSNTSAAGAAIPITGGVAWPQVAYMNVGGTDYIYLSGGLIGASGAAQSGVYRYNIGTNSWSANLGNMPATIWSAANGVLNGYWVLAGGFVNGAASNAVYSYLPSSNSWTLNASPMPQARSRGSGAVTSTSLYSVGGMTTAGGFAGTTDNQAYTPSLCAPGLISVVSRQTHGAAGTFDLALSTTSTVVEPRSTGGNYQIIFNYAVPVNSGTASASGGVGTAGSPSFSGNSVTVPVSGVSDQQRLTVTANGVSGPGTGSTTMGTQIGFLIGDVNGDGVVNVGDTAQARGAAGATLDTTNFLNDVNLDGMVNVGDTIIVRGNSGNALP